eukprot:TRINITY_DN8394_c0_g1_i1.p1 TRINITY_DN8394_c0_g1~~TRINITY_DN8394_c0_g1_i1.p1  ORF type:complete len:183 (-),score=40.61 TRINITY_DN8394_c0_g1_i1:247-795(-)
MKPSLPSSLFSSSSRISKVPKVSRSLHIVSFKKTRLYPSTSPLSTSHFLSLAPSTPSYSLFPSCSLNRYFTSENENEINANYQKIADNTLEQLSERLQTLEETLEEEFDLELASGVLTMKLGGKGTFVINKQAPNRQLWWSSPVSGPKRFEWDGKTKSGYQPETQIWCLLSCYKRKLPLFAM